MTVCELASLVMGESTARRKLLLIYPTLDAWMAAGEMDHVREFTKRVIGWIPPRLSPDDPELDRVLTVTLGTASFMASIPQLDDARKECVRILAGCLRNGGHPESEIAWSIQHIGD